MSRESLLIIIGALLMISPFTGLPLSILMWFYLALGLIVALIGVTLRIRRKRRAERTSSIHEASQTVLS
ncbi:MAG: hypothetical protein V4681_03985 [Patescibacteria group bacterium]